MKGKTNGNFYEEEKIEEEEEEEDEEEEEEDEDEEERLFVSGKRKDARPKHFKLGKTVNSYGTKLSKKHNNCSLQNCLKKTLRKRPRHLNSYAR